MCLSRLACSAVLVAAISGSAYASTITMRGGSGSEQFTTLQFNILLNGNGNDCVGNPGCVFANETGVTITEIDFVFNGPLTTFGCGIGPRSPFSQCETEGTPTQVTFEFFDGSLPNGGEFGLSFPVPFPPNTTLHAIANPTGIPEPGSAALLLTCLIGILVVWRGMRAAASSAA